MLFGGFFLYIKPTKKHSAVGGPGTESACFASGLNSLRSCQLKPSWPVCEFQLWRINRRSFPPDAKDVTSKNVLWKSLRDVSWVELIPEPFYKKKLWLRTSYELLKRKPQLDLGTPKKRQVFETSVSHIMAHKKVMDGGRAHGVKQIHRPVGTRCQRAKPWICLPEA